MHDGTMGSSNSCGKQETFGKYMNGFVELCERPKGHDFIKE